jgi:hypothetical protein
MPVQEESKEKLPPPESPKCVSKVNEEQTPVKKQSIGLTPEMKRLEQLRLSSGKRTLSRLSRVADREMNDVRRNLTADIDEEAAHVSQSASRPVAAAAESEPHSA